MNIRMLRRTRRQVASTLDDAIDKIEDATRALGKEADKAGGEMGAELAALPEQLQGLRRSIVETVEPYRPPKRYRPYVQLGLLVTVVAAVIAIVMRRRQSAARSAGGGLLIGPGTSPVLATMGSTARSRRHPGRNPSTRSNRVRGRVSGLRRLGDIGSGRPHAESWRTGLFRLPGPGVGRRVDPASGGEWLVTLSRRRRSGLARPSGGDVSGRSLPQGSSRCRRGCAVPDRGGDMRAVTVVPKTAGSLLVEEVPEPDVQLGSVLVEALAVGICGTDLEDRRRPIRMATAGA